MNLYFWIFLFLTPVGCENSNLKEPTVFISILVRNKAHTLPYFLSLLENLQYPKDRITLYIRSHHNSDESLEILNKWVAKVSPKKEYHNILKEFEKCVYPCLMKGEKSPVGWSERKFIHIMTERQKALDLARFYWSDYFWNLDSDVFLMEPNVLKDLVEQKLPVVAPLLTSLGYYSNFWGDMNEDFYYARSTDYSSIRERKTLGCHEVAMVHSSQLIDLRSQYSDLISFHPDHIQDYPGPQDDIIVFALSCSLNDIPMYVCNHQDYGMIMLPLEDDQTLADDFETLRYTLLETTSRHPPIHVDPIFHKYLISKPVKSKLNLDEIFLINLGKYCVSIFFSVL
jgi:collagen beta-1,O-galactosyltransferase